MMSKKIGKVIGRWQIYHVGHQALVQRALETNDEVIIVIGSAFKARDPKNPFTWEERKAMILATLTDAEKARVSFLPVRDYYDDERWHAVVAKGVSQLTQRGDVITLVGYKKDKSSYYLDDFDGPRLLIEQAVDVDATSLRAAYFGAAGEIDAALDVLQPYLPKGVAGFLRTWACLPAYQRVAKEQAALLTYRKKYTAPYYLTADSIVRASDHVLLIRRGGEFGHGLWALPGGFLNPGEQFYQAAVRELAEETGFKPFAKSLRAALQGQIVLDHPGRSLRGRLVSNCFYFNFGNMAPFEVEGQDDALEAKWVHIKDLHAYEELMFEDHWMGLDHYFDICPT